MKVRKMEPSDIEVVLGLGREAHQTSYYAKYPFSEDKCRTLLNSVLIGPDIICLVVEDEEQIIGFAIVVVTEHYFTTAKFASDLLIYVTPTCRSRFAGTLLISEVVATIRSQYGDIPITMGITTGVHPEKTGRLYQSLGFRPFGDIYIKEN